MSEVVTYKQVRQYDPSHTISLRASFARAMNKRFTELALVVKKSVYDNDCFGLKPVIHSLQMNPAPNKAFLFPRSAEKVEAFMEWLRKQVDAGIIQLGTANQLGTSVESAWFNLYILDSYKRGVLRARYELKKAGYPVPTIEASGGIAAIMNLPMHLDRVGILFTRTFSDMKGITAAMDMQISRILAQGIIDGDGPALLARKLVATINGTGMGELGITDKLGRFIPAARRAETLARTEIISTFAEASLQEYKNWGAVGVNALVEFQTAEDDRVCLQCSHLQGVIYTLEAASGVICVHPNCRCIWLPILYEDIVDKNLIIGEN
jgi:SPP1 gp7 family putative phage head morphogenesis protein